MTGYNKLLLLRHLRKIKRTYEGILERTPNTVYADRFKAAIDEVTQTIALVEAMQTKG